ncbi:ABC transporter substrate-binding protein [Rathayibacter sp. VKM Ac-2760]|uniref:ABC transporter substrate-binding protein n=1 Tax=Rathayibacter sp. VKM Ac-2760 TaxID=2609253 RepID=UPI0013174AC3|nr:ABC transporter substrate-binding protein [Rathayibacter sp. VKM Ac-2760]QHC60170.1 ABC transporter substrate-binding protein [Rathayibacter sp. VKM Ac-2760]
MKPFRRRAVVAVSVAAVLALAGCSAPGESDSGAGDASVLSLAASPEEPTSWDPAQAGTGTAYYYQAVYDTLIRVQPDGSYIPNLATEWTYDDAKTALTMTLRDDVTFTDGSTLDSAVVAANLQRFAGEGGSDSTMLAALASVDTPDATTVVLNLSRPDPALIYSLSNSAGFIGSLDAIEAGTIDTDPVGSGPYVLDAAATTVGSVYTFDRTEDYWGEDLPYDSIELQPIQDTAARINALLSGEVNGALLSNASSGQEAEAAGFTHIPSEIDFHGIFIFDREGADVPALGDERVRQAMNHAIDRDLLVEQAMFGEATATDQIWAEGTLGFNEEYEDYYDFDPDEARSLLAEAGYADGVELTMPVVSIFDNTVLTLTQQMLADVGITVTYVDVPIADLFNAYTAGEYPSTFMQYSAGEDWVLINDYIAADANWNPFGASTPESDALVAEYPTATTDRQAEIAQELNTIVVEDAWFVPFYRAIQQLYIDDTVTTTPQVGEANPTLYSWAPAA